MNDLIKSIPFYASITKQKINQMYNEFRFDSYSLWEIINKDLIIKGLNSKYNQEI